MREVVKWTRRPKIVRKTGIIRGYNWQDYNAVCLNIERYDLYCATSEGRIVCSCTLHSKWSVTRILRTCFMTRCRRCSKDNESVCGLGQRKDARPLLESHSQLHSHTCCPSNYIHDKTSRDTSALELGYSLFETIRSVFLVDSDSDSIHTLALSSLKLTVSYCRHKLDCTPKSCNESIYLTWLWSWNSSIPGERIDLNSWRPLKLENSEEPNRVSTLASTFVVSLLLVHFCILRIF